MPQLPKEPTVEWRHRESERLSSGRYEKVPWHDQSFHRNSPFYSLHYAHVDMDGKGLVSFTPDERRGESDSQTVMKVRKYLHLHFAEYMKKEYNYEQEQMDKFVEDWASKLLLQVAKTPVFLAMNPDHIRWVLEHSRNIIVDGDDPDNTPSEMKHRGCPSCMTYLPERYRCKPIMPCEIMGYGDLAISHVVDPDNPMLVKARCIVWPEKKLSSGYLKGRDGWEEKLRVGLKALGYTEGSMYGAKMYRWLNPNNDKRLVAPYLDFNGRVKDHGTYLEITDGDGYSAGNTDGTLSQCQDWYCTSCEESFSEDDWSCTPFDDRVCEGCYNEYYMTCDRCDEYGNRDDANSVGNDFWCESCVDGYAFYCNGCGESVDLDDTAGDYNGDEMCEDCFNDDDELHRKDSCSSIVRIQTETVTVARCGCCDDEELSREEA